VKSIFQTSTGLLLKIESCDPLRETRVAFIPYNLYFAYIDVDSVKETVSKAADELGKKVEENKSVMISVVSQLVDKLTGKDLAIIYEFDNLQIDIPKATGPDGKELGSAKWKINGKIVISSELHDKNKSIE
jgi:hypothetical protein